MSDCESQGLKYGRGILSVGKETFSTVLSLQSWFSMKCHYLGRSDSCVHTENTSTSHGLFQCTDYLEIARPQFSKVFKHVFSFIDRIQTVSFVTRPVLYSTFIHVPVHLYISTLIYGLSFADLIVGTTVIKVTNNSNIKLVSSLIDTKLNVSKHQDTM